MALICHLGRPLCMLYKYTALVCPMPDPIIHNEIPVPSDAELLKQYLALGWYQLNDPPRLKWSFGRGSPRHPGDRPAPPVNRSLEILDVMVLHELDRHLPMAGNYDGDRFELRAVLTVRYQKVERRQKRYKGSPLIATWKPADAELTVLPEGTCND